MSIRKEKGERKKCVFIALSPGFIKTSLLNC